MNGFQPQTGNFFNVLTAGGGTLASSFATITGTDHRALSPGFKLNRVSAIQWAEGGYPKPLER